jgi:ArsR family transcriptional regulator, arsenate/arsenite/antimonite-responsive transcriptional repressor
VDESLAAASLAALAQGQRLRIMRAWVGAGPRGLNPGAPGATLGLPASTPSFHPREPPHAGVESQQRGGRQPIDRPEPERTNALLAYLTAHSCRDAACELAASRGGTTC